MTPAFITSLLILAALVSGIRPLRNGFYALHMLLVAVGVWFTGGQSAAALFSPAAFTLFLLWHLPSISLVTFLAYGFDKRAARKGAWRVSEKQLLALAFIGGTPGAWLGQKVFRHKTRKTSFQKLSWLVLTVQACVLAALLAR